MALSYENSKKCVNAIAPLNAKLTLNAMNANLTLNAMNANLSLNAMNHEVIRINTKVISGKVYDAKCMTAKCMITMNSRTNNDEKYQHITFLSYKQRRDRAPSRVPAKKICRLLTKSRKLRRAVRKEIKRNVPASSCIHRYAQASSHEYQRVVSNNCFHEFIKTRLNCKKSDSVRSAGHVKSKCKLHMKKQFYNNLKTVNKTKKLIYKDSNHNYKVNYCKLTLCGDIEVNPGPTFNNPMRTIHAPYSQGSVDIFGENADRQCVPMSLCSLIYVYRNNSVLQASDLVNIMNLGNQLYSALSRLSKQRYLLLEELPTMVTVEDSDYSLEFSQSYTGNLHVSVVNDNVPFVMPLDSALERLQQEMFSLFLLTVEYNTVSIFTDSNGLLKVFDSHARDSFGMPHPHGTCVLLEFDSISDLTGYFKQLYRPGAIFEVKGVKVNYVCNEILQNVDTNNGMPYSGSDSDTKINCSSPIIENESMNDNLNYKIAQSYYVFLYAICFSTIKACNYWNDQTQIAIAEHAIELFDKVSNINPLLSTYLPKSTEICGKTFDIVYTSRHEGTLHCISTSSKDALAEVISCNTMNNAGFLICFEIVL